jgi:membrane protease YdiL (CAAX protease family)
MAAGGPGYPSGERDLLAICGVGIVYVISIAFQETIMSVGFSQPSTLTVQYLAEHGGIYTLSLAAIPIPALSLLVTLWLTRRRAPVFQYAVRPLSWGSVTKAVIYTILLSVTLNALDLWPFSWRWAGSTTAVFVQTLLYHDESPAILIWAATIIIAIPIIEEFIFRLGILRLVASRTRSDTAGIAVSSILFGIGHLGNWPIWHAGSQTILNAVWLTAGASVLGWIAVRTNSIVLPIAAHAARNATDFALLLLAISGP